jgi:predicted acyl esterase
MYHIDGDSLRGTYTSSRRRYTVTLTRATVADAMTMPSTVSGVLTGTTVRIPMKEAGGKSLTLEATLYRPHADGPHPVLLFNHGSTGTIAPSMTMRPSRQAPFFVERGFAVLAPMRRGRGSSDGAHEEFEGTCAPDVLGAGFARAIEDVDAAMASLATVG